MKKDSKEPKGAKRSRAEDWIEQELTGVAEEALSLGLPLHVFLGEVIDASKFTKAFWEPIADGPMKRPGLRSAQKATFDEDIADEMIALHALAQQAQTEVLLSAEVPESAAPLMAAGRDLLDTITAALEWCFDDGVEDDKDAQLAAVRAHHEELSSIDALAAALVSYAALAEKYVDELDGSLDFERTHIDEARKLAAQLNDVVPKGLVDSATSAAISRRNKLVVLLQRRLKKVRTAAKLVFRKFPSISQQATSGYQRRARAELRRRRETPVEPAKG